MSKSLRCMVNWHRWEHRTNPEVGGRNAVYFVCTSCGKEKMAWEPPAEGGMRGLAGGGGLG